MRQPRPREFLARINFTANLISDASRPGIQNIINRLKAQGFMVRPDQSYFKLQNNGGLLSMAPSGSGFLTSGPGNRGYDFNNDNDWKNHGHVAVAITARQIGRHGLSPAAHLIYPI